MDTEKYRLIEAQKAHERGWPLTPLKGKRPNLKNWQKNPKPTLQEIERWARAGNLGLRTGKISGVVVIDDDNYDGSGISALNLPITSTVITGSGKHHYYFKCPENGLRNSVSKIAYRVDIRGDGGQVVFPGSIHPETQKPYLWSPELSPDEVPLAKLPNNLLALLITPTSVQIKDSNHMKKLTNDFADSYNSQYENNILNEAFKSISTAVEGTRNNTLYRKAFRFGCLLSEGQLNRDIAIQVLKEAASKSGLEESEIECTLKSGLDAGGKYSFNRHKAQKKTECPQIMVKGGDLPDLVDQAEAAILSDATESIYQRGENLVRLVRTKAPNIKRGFKRESGALIIQRVQTQFLVEKFTRTAEWIRLDRRDNKDKRIDCPDKIAKTYMARAGQWKLPHLLGVVEAPTIRPDGSILSKPGYDVESGFFFDPGETCFQNIPSSLTLDDARRVLAELSVIIRDFSWVDRSDRSAALAAILTALVRPSLRTAPMFAFRAPKRGSGKSLLADVVAMVATGRVAPVMSQGKDEDEDRKRILAILMEGEAVACIDNVEKPLGGSALCSVLTQESWKDRILGVSEMATVPTTITWLATGNNLTFVGDLTSRVVPCDLDPKCERPEERKFDLNLYDYIPKNRGKLVSAALTILHAYNKAGRPKQNLSIMGRFEEWSDLVRSALVWCGEADPCEGRKRLEEADPVQRRLQALLQNWHRKIGDAIVTANEVIKMAKPDSGEESEFWQALNAVSHSSDGKPSARCLGKYLRSNEKRIEKGLKIARAGEKQGVALWQVIKT